MSVVQVITYLSPVSSCLVTFLYPALLPVLLPTCLLVHLFVFLLLCCCYPTFQISNYVPSAADLDYPAKLQRAAAAKADASVSESRGGQDKAGGVGRCE